MHRDIILFAFAKAKNEELEEHGIQASTTRAAERISAYISDHSSIPYGSKMLRIGYNKAKDPNEGVEIKQPQVVNALCTYLGFENYEGYALSKEVPVPKTFQKRGPTRFLSRYKWHLLIVFSVVVGSVMYLMTNKQRWMVWDETHYIEVPFDAETFQKGGLKLLNKDNIQNFVKVTLTRDSIFFNPDGSTRFWYGKSSNKELEFFTDLAKHPETGKALRPLSTYMIKKYICVD